MMEFYLQGDVLLERVADVAAPSGQLVPPHADGSVVLAEGEVTGHRHRFTGDSGGVVMFRDDGLARDVPSDLYLGHIKIAGAAAALLHEEHDPIVLPAGTYRVRAQREYDAGEARRVLD